MNIRDRMIMEEYRKQKSNFDALGLVVHDLLKRLIKGAGIPVMNIEHRVKQEKSLEGKLYRKGDRYSRLSDLTDILGARVVCYFSDEVDEIGKIVEQTFTIDRENSCDKRKLMADNSFGYLSLHYICSLPQDAGFPTELCGIKFEIQIRTILQHAWAAINHDLGYKSQFGVPHEVTREFSRLAGLLEIADDEFVRVRESMDVYTENTRSKIVDDQADDVLIDMISLNEYVLHNKKMRAFLETLAGICGAEIAEINPEGYIPQLVWLGKKTIGDVQRMLEQDSALAQELFRHSFAATDLDILASNVGLRFLCRAELLIRGCSEAEIAQFLRLSVFDEKRAADQAKRLLRTYGNIKGGVQ